ncbi:MAG: hypothetical protein K0Q72_2861 [Armatimonadetes bacterium]|jgi:thiol:disulfide interchange protein|nr:hypothetical protein [Armatimonadota bacterium]
MSCRPRCLAALFSLGLVAFSLIPANAGEIKWQKTLKTAQQEAKRTKKRLFVECYATWCGPCKAMYATTLKDEDVVKLSRQFVAVRVDVDQAKEFANKYQVESIPFSIVFEPDGRVVRASRGFLDAKTFCLFLKQSLRD